ncbi:MAG: argininosuccinate lyase [Candidatus Methylacidiphilales bacterium]|nr:argininosuccinate lyase [Candidatus Methylacidiphilales bacterium]
MKKPSPKKSQALWGGRFASETHRLVQELGKSVHYDHRLYREDIAGSIAHARMLKKIGILSAGELRAIEKGLRLIEAQITDGKFAWLDSREDVHMNIEAALTARTPAGARLHTGRSRNDQVATDMRLWLKKRINEDLLDVAAMQAALVRWASRDAEILLPGYTHLQRAQPVYLAHHLLAYVEMLERDKGRLSDACKRLDLLPLGSGALAGSTIPLDREFVARELGFAGVTANSLDAVSDRDFIIEYASAGALVAVHLSRLAEDLILWSTAEFGFIRIGDAFTTGSSLMPQKKNPDVAELTRGKSGRVIGNLVSLLVLLKGLPMTYNRDLQEDKERLFDTADTLRLCLRVNAAMLGDIRVNREACARAVADPCLLATDIADALVLKGVPFRHAHEIVGRAVGIAEQKGCTIAELGLAEWKTLSDKVDARVLAVFDPVAALERRKMTGAPSRRQVNAQLARWKKKLGL